MHKDIVETKKALKKGRYGRLTSTVAKENKSKGTKKVSTDSWNKAKSILTS